MDKRSSDIERYLRGEMTPAEMHALEREALNDPFLSEALDGFSSIKDDTFHDDMQSLKKLIKKRSKKRRTKIISMWPWSVGIAAGLSFIAIVSIYLIGTISKDTKNQEHISVVSTDSTDTQVDSVEVLQKNHTAIVEESQDSINALEEHSIVNPIASNDNNGVQRIESNESLPSRTETPSTKSVTKNKNEWVITGQVTGDDGNPLIGVNVVNPETSVGTITDINGNYKLILNRQGETLVFSSLGYKDVRINTDDKSFNVQMETDLSQLSQVVVDGINITPPTSPKDLRLAEPVGGREAFEKYLQQKMTYPEVAIINKIEGKVTIEFTVAPTGTLTNFKVLDGLGFGCDEEVIRLIKNGPIWKPTRKNDTAVDEKVKVRLKFSLPE